MPSIDSNETLTIENDHKYMNECEYVVDTSINIVALLRNH